MEAQREDAYRSVAVASRMKSERDSSNQLRKRNKQDLLPEFSGLASFGTAGVVGISSQEKLASLLTELETEKGSEYFKKELKELTLGN